MANQLNLKKRIELLRLFINENNAVNAQLVQEKLLLSESSFFKTMRELNAIIHNDDGLNYTLSQSEMLLERLLVHDYEKPEMHIAQIFQTNSPTTKQLLRYILTLKLLHEHKQLSVSQLLEYAANVEVDDWDLEDALSWGKTEAKRILTDISEVGYATKGIEQKTKTHYYSIAPCLDIFSKEQLLQIIDYLSHIVYKNSPAVAGYLIMNKIKLQLGKNAETTSQIAYPYTYTGRLLDEPLCYELLDAIHAKKAVEIQYFEVKNQKKSVTKTAAKEAKKRIIPLQIVYDSTYYRWYLIGMQESSIPQCYRIDYIQSIKVLKETVKEYDHLYEQSKELLKSSWCISMEELVTIDVMFYQENVRFIEERVLREGQHGEIIKRFEDGRFLWRIKTRGTAEITPWLRSFGSSCEIIQPAPLREQFIQELQEVAKNYAK